MKKIYQTPTTEIVNVVTDQMLAISGQIDSGKPTGPALGPMTRWSNVWE